MQSAIYSGFVIHHRLVPKEHFFKYNVKIFFLDIDNLERDLNSIKIASIDKFNLLSFCRKNYLPDSDGETIRSVIQKKLHDKGYSVALGKIFMLSNLSYLGFCYNPVSFFYCYDITEQLRFIIAEVNNTPWNERYVYIQECVADQDKNTFYVNKQFHISPFMPMDIQYTWNFSSPAETVDITMLCKKSDEKILHVVFKLKRTQLNYANCFKAFISNPITTHLVLIKIYWQALLLFLKKTPVFKHPKGDSCV